MLPSPFRSYNHDYEHDFDLDDDNGDDEEVTESSNEFQVLKIQGRVMRKLERLDDSVLFLSTRSGSISVKASDSNKLKGNKIFFLGADYYDDRGEHGVFCLDLEDGKIERCFPSSCPMTWFLSNSVQV